MFAFCFMEENKWNKRLNTIPSVKKQTNGTRVKTPCAAKYPHPHPPPSQTTPPLGRLQTVSVTFKAPLSLHAIKFGCKRFTGSTSQKISKEFYLCRRQHIFSLKYARTKVGIGRCIILIPSKFGRFGDRFMEPMQKIQ